MRNGDRIKLSIKNRTIDLLVDEATLAKRRAEPRQTFEKPTRGYAKLFAEEITGADLGCDFRFLQGDALSRRSGQGVAATRQSTSCRKCWVARKGRLTQPTPSIQFHRQRIVGYSHLLRSSPSLRLEKAARISATDGRWNRRRLKVEVSTTRAVRSTRLRW